MHMVTAGSVARFVRTPAIHLRALASIDRREKQQGSESVPSQMDEEDADRLQKWEEEEEWRLLSTINAILGNALTLYAVLPT